MSFQNTSRLHYSPALGRMSIPEVLLKTYCAPGAGDTALS